MKISAALPLALLLSVSTISAFVSPLTTTRIVPRTTLLEATNKNEKGRWGSTVTGVVLGWTLATRIASASIAPQAPAIIQSDSFLGGSPTTLIAAGAYVPENGYDSLDMSMPSYTVEERAPPKPDNNGIASDSSTAADPTKKNSSKAQVAAESEEAQAKAYFKKQEAKAAKAAEKAAIKAKVDAGRAAAQEAKVATAAK